MSIALYDIVDVDQKRYMVDTCDLTTYPWGCPEISYSSIVMQLDPEGNSFMRIVSHRDYRTEEEARHGHARILASLRQERAPDTAEPVAAQAELFPSEGDAR
jgi:hypothetical protein